jgi:FixJ family two-component response regulator
MSIFPVPPPPRPDLQAELATLLATCETALTTIADPLERARSADRLTHLTAELRDVLRRVRGSAIAELVAGGKRRRAIAADLGVSSTRISQLVKAAPAVTV